MTSFPRQPQCVCTDLPQQQRLRWLAPSVGLSLAMGLMLVGCKPETRVPPAPESAPESALASLPATAPSPVASAPEPARAAAPPVPTLPPAASTAVLRQMTAPIALYPDKLVAQVLAATQFPDQVTAAERWLGQNPGLIGRPLVQAVSAQAWDPAIKSLTEFPNVLAQLASNLPWTRALGSAYAQSPSDVLAAIQSLRQVATQSGQLKSGEQISVRTEPAEIAQGQAPEPAIIVIEPTQPRTVYVPQYDPQALLREALPGDAGHAALGNGAIAFGSGVVVGRWLIDSWGWQPWDMRWRGHGHRPGSHYDRPGPPRPPLPPYPGPDQPRPPAPIALNVKPPPPAPVHPGTSVQMQVQVPPPPGQRPPPNVNVNARPPVRSNDRPIYRLPGEEVPSAPAGMPLGTQPTQFGQPGQASQPGHAHGSTGMVGNGNGAAGHSQTPKPPHLQPGGDPILRPNGAVPVQPPHPAQPPQAIPAPAAGHPSGRSDAGNWRMAPPGTQQAANRPDLSPPVQTKPAPIDSRGELGRNEVRSDGRSDARQVGRSDTGRYSNRQPEFAPPVGGPHQPGRFDGNRGDSGRFSASQGASLQQAPRNMAPPAHQAPRAAQPPLGQPARMGRPGHEEFRR